jgi:Mg-chelatase subunit ChlD
LSVDFLHPLRLLLLPLCAAAVFAMAFFRRSRNRKERLSHLLRYAIILLTVLALAGTGILAPSPDRTAWLLVDASASAGTEQTLELARQALANAGENRRVGVIAFGRDARVERGLGQAGELSGIESRVDRGASNLGEALQLASALLPADANGGIAVISDGLVTMDTGDREAVEGIPVNVLKTAHRGGPDAQVTKVEVPAELYAGQKYTTVVTVHANTAGNATLVLNRNRQTVETREVALRKGENTFAFEAVAEGSGVVTCGARLVMDGDTVSMNDENSTFSVVNGEIGVLLVQGSSGQGEAGSGGELKKMLEAAGIRVTVIPDRMLPSAAADLWAYQAVALVNVDAENLSAEQIAALDTAAKELGVGVAVFGGDSSYALGGYRGSALEKMLPVTIDVKNRMDLPRTALVLVIDKSGSMMDEAWGISRLALAREAACSALEVLTERDQAGVIAFDDEGKWVVPLSPVADVKAMQEQVATIRPGGGTAFYTPLAMAYEALKTVQADYRHVIFLTDGEAGDTGYQLVVQSMAQEGITLTTVAVGDGADTAGMRQLAKLGGGRAYTAGPFDSLPRIFTRDTMQITGSYVQNRTFIPVVTDASMTGFDGFPALHGYLGTTEKPLATVSLASDREDPILAWWQYGAGKVLCWTSDTEGGWTRSFLSWDQAASFFAGMISWILPESGGDGDILLSEGMLRYRAEKVPDSAARAEASVVRPDGSRETLVLERVSADEFAAAMDTSLSGAYAVDVAVKDREGTVLGGTRGGGVIAWSREYDQRVRDEGTLEKLAEETGGKVCTEPEGLLDFPNTAARKRVDLTAPLMLLAGFLFLFDVAQRRLDWLKEKEKNPEEAPREKRKKQPQTDKESKKEPPRQAAEVLWENMQKRKRL